MIGVQKPRLFLCVGIIPDINLPYIFLFKICSSDRFYLTQVFTHGSLIRYAKRWVAHAPGMPGTSSPPLRFSDPDMHHGTCVTHVPWCMPGSLTRGFLWSRRRGKRSRHSRRMRNPQLCVYGKRSILLAIDVVWTHLLCHSICITIWRAFMHMLI